MSRSRYSVLPLVLGLFAATACEWNLGGPAEVCLHSEGCDGDGTVSFLPTTLVFHGLVTSAASGERLRGVTVRLDAPARGWSETAVTDSAGYFSTSGLPDPAAGACDGLSVSFSREGYQPLRVIDFPLLSCARGYGWVVTSLTPNP